MGRAVALALLALIALATTMTPRGALAAPTVDAEPSRPDSPGQAKGDRSAEIFSKEEFMSLKGRKGGVSVGQAIASKGKNVVKKANTKISDAALEHMANDRTAFVDPHAKIFFVDDEMDAEEEARHMEEWLRRSLVEVGGDEAANELEQNATDFCAGITETELLLLESRPSSNKVMVLDFTGHTVEGTNNPWTTNFGATGNYTVAPWNLSGSATERENACLIWHIVAHVYAFSDVNVTTNENLLPYQDTLQSGTKRSALERDTSSDQFYGVRSIMHRDNKSPPFLQGMPNEADGCGCGGIAYVGIFGDLRGSWYYREHHTRYYSPWSMGAACSHEIGHNVGLSHDGVSGGATYYGSHKVGDFVGDSDASSLSKLRWGPVMGSGYYNHISHFAQAYTSGTSTISNGQDDFAQMAANMVLPDPDTNESDTIAGAAAKTAEQDVAATIGPNGDVDVFRFDQNLAGTACGGGVISCKFTATVAASRSNLGTYNNELRGTDSPLNVGLEILDGAGNVLAVGLSNPTASSAVERFLGATVTADVIPGNGIYVRVAGYGYHEPMGHFHDDSSAPISPTAPMEGFLSFGSVGSYMLKTSTAPGSDDGIDSCLNQPCFNGGACQDLPQGYLCTCTSGFFGDSCEFAEVNECEPDPCQNGGLCTDNVGAVGFTCNCTDTGFTGATCETNIDDCVSNGCSNGGTCVDGINDYWCDCSTADPMTSCTDKTFSDGTAWYDIDGPTYDCAWYSSGTNCSAYGNSYSNGGLTANMACCVCGGGDLLSVGDAVWGGPMCTDVVSDLCDGNNCSGNGTCQAGVCTCAAGYTGTTCETNIDDCASNPCLHGSCTDGVNSFSCSCDSGWTGTNCDVDVNECSTANGGCEQTCTNSPGSFACSCGAGYSLNGDGLTCDDVNECADAGLNDCASTGATCTNTVGSYSCSCDSGFTGDGTVCTNIDDCASNPCQNNGTCIDGVNAYTCACTADYTGQTCTDPVCTKVCANGGTCQEGGAGTDTCACTADYTGQTCTDPVCTKVCANGTCTEGGEGTDTCTCDAGYSGDTCDTFTCNDDCTRYDNDSSGCRSVCDPTGSGLYCTYNRYGKGKNRSYKCEMTNPSDPAWA